jgi:hypothetical protein
MMKENLKKKKLDNRFKNYKKIIKFMKSWGKGCLMD